MSAGRDELVELVQSCWTMPDLDPGRGLVAQGLGSLAAVRIAVELTARHGVEITVADLATASIDDLVAMMSGSTVGRAAPAGAGGSHGPDDRGTAPLLPLQQAYRVGSESGVVDDAVGCHLYREYELEGTAARRPSDAWDAVVRRHPCLRARVTPGGDLAFDARPVLVEHAVDADGHAAAVEATRRRLAARLDRLDELVRAEVVAGPGGTTLHLSIDGLVTDGFGLMLMLAELLGGGPSENGEVPPDELVGLLRGLLAARPDDADVAHWRERLAGAPAGPFAQVVAERAEAAGETPVARRAIAHTLAEPVWRGLRERAHALDVSPTALVLAAFAETLCGAAGTDGASVVLTASDRARLPASARAVAGPFTSSLVLPVCLEPGETTAELAARLHRDLWTDLRHAALSGVEALRGAGDAPVASGLPVVFTSMLDAVPDGAGVARALAPRAALCQTSGVALDHQMWEVDGELVLRWDVADDLVPSLRADRVFARLVNRLVVLGSAAAPAAPLGVLATGYAIDRLQRDAGAAPGCAAVFSVEIDPDAVPDVGAAWAEIAAGRPGLRRSVDPDLTSAQAPAGPAVLAAVESPGPGETWETARRRVAEELAATPRPLGRAPGPELVCVVGDGRAAVTVGLDLLHTDAPGLHEAARALARRLGPGGAAGPAEPATSRPVARPGGPAAPAASAYWQAKFSGLSGGPDTTAGSDDSWVRHDTTVPGADALRTTCAEHDVELDWLLTAALADAWRAEADRPVGLLVVDWPPVGAGTDTGADRSRLAWVQSGDEPTIWERARAIGAAVRADHSLDWEAATSVLRGGDTEFPVVYTAVTDWGDTAPDRLQWITETPGVAFDAVGALAGGSLRLRVDAVSGRFAPGAVQRVVDAYVTAVRTLAATATATATDAGTDIGTDIGTDEAAPAGEAVRDEPAEDVARWNATDRPFDAPGPLFGRIVAAAARRPDAVAVRWRDGTWSFEHLVAVTNGIAHRLRDRGVSPGESVAVVVRRGPMMIAAALGVQMAGGAYVPVEPDQPEARARSVLSVAECTCVVTTADTGSWLTPALRSGLDVVEATEADARPDAPEPITGVDDRAYVIFTSGSTGEPKGVAVRHRAVHNLLQWCERVYGFGPDDCGLCVTSLGFDLSVFDLFGLLGVGASLYVADAAEQHDPGELVAALNRAPITFWNSAPTALDHLRPYFDDVSAAARDRVRLFFLSGDYTPLSLPEPLSATFPHATLVSLGGATEATVWSNYHEVRGVDPAWRSIPYGRPIDNARYYVFDDELRHCPPGVTGELYIAGAVLADGYVNRPELTDERFVPEPGRPGERMYRTGDLAQFFPDGVIEFCGRADSQVKIRGHRVELGEIEHAVREVDAVRDVVVAVRRGPQGDQQLVAYLVADGEADVTALRAHLRDRLPAYMVPGHYAVLERFPATENGKLDRAALPWPLPAADQGTSPDPLPGTDPGTAPDTAPAAVAEPVTPAEPAVGPAAGSEPVADPVAVVEPAPASPPAAGATTGVDIAAVAAWLPGAVAGQVGHDVAPDADLWDSGATSYTMVQLAVGLRSEFGLRVALNALVARPTLTGMVDTIAAKLGVPSPSTAPEPVAGPADEPVEDTVPDLLFDEAGKRALLGSGVTRPVTGPERFALPRRTVPAPWLDWRGSHREFSGEQLELDRLGSLLGWVCTHGEAARRRLYPSAGDTYAVQVYVVLEDGRTELPSGSYWLDPDAAELRRVGAGTVDRRAHIAYNRPIADSAAGSIVLVGERRGIAPLYGADADEFLLLEAGCLAQMLLLAQPATGIGLCPVGRVDDAAVGAALGLSDGQRVLHSLLFGAVDHDVPDAAPLPLDIRSSPPGEVAHEPAVLGYAARFAGCPDPETLWATLLDGRTLAHAVPPTHDDDIASLTAAALLDDRGQLVDTTLFPIAEREDVDPQLRVLLELIWECLERSGVTPARLESDGRAGLFVGYLWPDHHLAATEAGGATSALASQLTNRLSHAFGFTGPSVAVDTSCTSFLTALDAASSALRAGTCTTAVVCAANVLAHPSHARLLAELGFVATAVPDGAYDPDQGGWVVGEGGAALLLGTAGSAGPLAVARARLEGTGIGFVGAEGRFGYPDADAQRDTIAATLERTGLRPEDVDYVELAASGAVLSDAAELDAVHAVFPNGVLAGTVKPNIGHLEAASGAAQAVKALLCFEHDVLPASLLAARRDELLDSGSDRVQLVGESLPFPRGDRPRRVLLNGVGATGTLAQAVLRDAAVERRRDGDGPLLLVLSAAVPTSLRRLAGRYADALGDADRPTWMRACATTQMGRTALAHRVLVAAEDPVAALAALRCAQDGQPHPALHGAGSDVLPVEARRWLQGEDVDWAPLWAVVPAVADLPTYQFEHDVRPTGNEPGATDEWADLLPRLYAEAAGFDAPADADAPLATLGLSSRVAVAVARAASDHIESGRVDAGQLYRHQTLAESAEELTQQWGPPQDVPADDTHDGHATTSQVEQAEQAGSHGRPVRPDAPLAIIGLAGRFPGATDLEQLWDHLAAGHDLVTDAPHRAGLDRLPAAMRRGGYLDDIEHFDPLLFNIAPSDAARMDPQERLALEVVWEALDDAGYPRSRLAERLGGRVGVFAGVMHNEYPLLGADASTDGERVDVGGTPAGVANRISYHFDLHGPSMSVDTMCSSSLVALDLAARALRCGVVDAAIVVGVNIAVHPNKNVQAERMGMRSAGGRCATFGAAADGFVAGEGVVALVMRDAGDAAASTDRVHGLVRGTAVTHGGLVSGYTVPNPAAQRAAIAAALADGGVPAADVDYVETHGTGTALGDPIEVGALRDCLDGPDRAAPLSLGSIKSNLGHLEAAAGVAGLAKVLLQMRHRMLAPSLHASPANPEIRWGSCRVPDYPEPWSPRDGRDTLLAGVSSFGAGGTNAHVVVESPPRPSPATGHAGDGSPVELVLSAASTEQARTQSAALAEHLETHDVDLADVAYTLVTGREPLRHRWAVAARDRSDAVSALRAFAGGSDAQARRLADGERPGAPDGRIVALPAYPFARLRCWVDTVPGFVVRPDEPALARRVWRTVATPPPGPPARLVIVGDQAGPSANAVAATWDAASGRTGSAPVETAVATPDEAGALLAPAVGPATVVLLEDLDPHVAFALVQRVAVRPASARLHVVALVRGLLEPSDAAPDAARARLAAELATLAAEYRHLDVTTLDLSTVPPQPEELVSVLRLLDAAGVHGEVCCVRDERGVHLRVPEWTDEPDGGVPSLDGSAAYVVSGATGGLGLLAAGQLVRWGARRIVLTGRVRSPRFDEAVAAWEADGVHVTVHLGDITDSGALRAPVTSQGPVRGVVHCAGVSSRAGGPLTDVGRDVLDSVAAPKVDGLTALLGVLDRDVLDFVVAYGSTSALVPSAGAGLGDYAAANRGLDLTVDLARRQGVPGAASIAWPVWESSAADETARAVTRGAGLPVLDDDAGLRLLGAVIATASAGAGGRFAAVPAEALRNAAAPSGDAVAPAPEAPAATPSTRVEPAATSPVAAAPAPRAASGPGWLVDIVAARVGLPSDQVDVTLELGDLGVASVMLARLVEDIEERLGRPVEPGLLLMVPRLDQLAAALGDPPDGTADAGPSAGAGTTRTAPAADTAAVVEASTAAAGTAVSADAVATGAGRAAEAPAPATVTAAMPAVAVVGLAAQMPGAPTIEVFWANVTDGICSIDEVPPGRWDVERIFDPAGGPGRSVSRWGGFLPAIDEFDPDHFGMTESEATALDPAIRLVLETAEQCLADAGRRAQELSGVRTGVFVGSRMGDYGRRASAAGDAALGGDQNFIAARLAHHLDVDGPTLVVDTACSSALSAVHLAVQSLATGDTELAIAGGVDVLLDESVYVQFTRAGALSADGRCRTFDERADGFVPGEGCGLMLLKRLDRAVADGDRIHAVIEGSAVNNDGRTMGLTTPGLEGQKKVVRQALAGAGVGPDDIGLLEAHGTATRIGDPIELRALTEVFRSGTDRVGYCAIGSVKSNIGHLMSAAGIAGLIKVVLAVEHGLRPPTLFCEKPNPRFDFASSPFFPATTGTPWPRGPRRAGVSAFGLGGSNAHVVVGQAPPGYTARVSPLAPPVLNRRRFWLPAPDGPVAPPAPVTTESSLLDLDFSTPLSAFAPDPAPATVAVGSHDGSRRFWDLTGGL